MSSHAGSIVVGVDGSAASSHALVWALEQAAVEHRPITLVHAIHPGTRVWLDPAAHDPHEGRRLALEAKGREVLAASRTDVPLPAQDVTVHELVHIGDPREVLLALSETASLVVLGSRGRGPLPSLLLGSTSVAVVRHAHCPVVVHRPAPAGTPRQGVAVGVDASLDSITVLDFAFRQAVLGGEPLSVVHTRHFPSSVTGEDPFADPSWAQDEQGVRMADRIAELSEKYPDVRVETIIGEGMPERLLLDLADRVALLVVGVHHRSWAAQITFGSMAVWLVEHASCPVAAVPLSTAL